MAAAIAGAALKGVSPVIAVPAALLCAMAAGGAYAFIPGVSKVKMKVNEVITTIMLNFVAIFFCTYLANGPLKQQKRALHPVPMPLPPPLRFPSWCP